MVDNGAPIIIACCYGNEVLVYTCDIYKLYFTFHCQQSLQQIKSRANLMKQLVDDKSGK